jgi:hypothetical protein
MPQQAFPGAMPSQPGMPAQPGMPWQGGPLPQAGYPAGLVPPTTPANGVLAQPPMGDEDDGHGKKLLFIVAIAVVAVLLIGGSVAAVLLSSKKPTKTNTNSTASQSCTDPTTGTTLSKQNAEITYVRVAQAIKEKNQTCVTSLSSAYFSQVQALTFPNTNGQWITKSEDNLPSLASRLANIPSSFTVSQFTSSDYTRAATTDSTGKPVSGTTLPKGITLSYSITDAYTKEKAYLEISFIANNGKVAVDYLKLVPQSTSTNAPSKPTTQSPADPNAGAVAANQELAQEDVITIGSYLSTFRGNGGNSYPSTINATTFIDAGIGVDTSVFNPPTGTSFVYTPSPSSCTTAAKNCTSYTLTAMDTVDNTTIYSTSGSVTGS